MRCIRIPPPLPPNQWPPAREAVPMLTAISERSHRSGAVRLSQPPATRPQPEIAPSVTTLRHLTENTRENTGHIMAMALLSAASVTPIILLKLDRLPMPPAPAFVRSPCSLQHLPIPAGATSTAQ